MIYTIDTEFWESGRKRPIELISLGVVAEDGRCYYATNSEFRWNLVPKDAWIQENVKPHLADPRNKSMPNRTYTQMKQDLIMFFSQDTQPEFWGYYADYDWVVFCQIFGTMVELPKTFPQMCMDVNQTRKELGLSKMAFPKQGSVEHNALNDAIWTMDCVRIMQAHKKAQLDRLGLGRV